VRARRRTGLLFRTADVGSCSTTLRPRRTSTSTANSNLRAPARQAEADLLPKEESRDSDPDRYTQLRRMKDLAEVGAVTAEELMTSPALKRLPVVDAVGMLQGVVSRADLLKVFLRTDEEIAESLDSA
jgi:hypothetical protein